MPVMQTEFEATFLDIIIPSFQEKLKAAGAVLIKPRFIQKRITFQLPAGHEKQGSWLRVRDEGDRITMSYKSVTGGHIENQKEIMLIIDNFENAVELFKEIGCEQKAYQETYRELWKIGETEVTIDEWPFLEPYVEVEGASEEVVKQVSTLLNLDYSKALFCSVDTIYSRKYGVSEDRINNHTPLIVFDMENPFLKQD